MRRWDEDEKVWEKVWRWEGVKMRRWDTDPPLLEEPCAQTLSGISFKSVPTPPRYQYLLVTGAKTRTKPNHVKTRKRVTWKSMLDSPQQAPFFLLRCNSGKSKCHASQGHLCSHPAWTPLVLNNIHHPFMYPVWHQRHLVSRLCHHPSSQIHLCSPNWPHARDHPLTHRGWVC